MNRYLKNTILVITILTIVGLVHYHRSRKSANGHEATVTDIVTFDVAIGDRNIGKIEIGLFGNKAPRTVENFLAFAGEGVNGHKYQGSIFHRVIKNFMIQGGDVVNGDGTGSISKFGDTFDDELPSYKHTVTGLLSMANRGRNTNGSQFFITTVLTHWLDGKHVVFGRVLNEKSMAVVSEIEGTPVGDSSRPQKPVKIISSSVKHLQEGERFPIDIGAQ